MKLNLKQHSIAQGLIIPESEGLEIYKHCSKEPASLHEMELARKPHRWPEMRKLHKQYFNALMDKVEYYETEILDALSLPPLDAVRADSAKESDSFKYTKAQLDDVDVLLQEWTAALIADSKDSNAVYNFFELSAFSIGLKRTYESVISGVSDEVAQMLIAKQIMPSMDNHYLNAVVKQGGKRIKAALGKKWWDKVLPQLKRMAREGRSPIEVARWMHRNAKFEGEAWYWLRLARTESILALEAAFDAQCEAMGIKYEEWSTSANPCFICSGLGGMTWQFDRGPKPGYDTHPNCMCIRIPLYGTDKPVQDRWNRESPYDIPYTVDEMNLITGGFRR